MLRQSWRATTQTGREPASALRGSSRDRICPANKRSEAAAPVGSARSSMGPGECRGRQRRLIKVSAVKDWGSTEAALSDCSADVWRSWRRRDENKKHLNEVVNSCLGGRINKPRGTSAACQQP